MKTKDMEVAASVLASWIGISVPAVSEYARNGVIPRAAVRGRYPLLKAVQAYIRHMKAAAAGRENPTAAERTRLLKAQADSVEKKVKALDKKLVSAADVAATWLDIKRSGRAKMLELPGRIAKRLPGRLSEHDLDVITKEVLLALKPFDDDDAAKAAATNA
jgi:phage terminase Nu1 subunit (DNA packaging protein)